MEVGTYEVKNKLSALLDRVERGEEITITRRGKPVARMIPTRNSFDKSRGLKAMETILARGKGATLGGLKIKDLVSEGRV